MSGSALQVQALTAGYRGLPVITDLTLPASHPGELVALVGPNAAGKSTLLRAMAHLVSCRGSVRLGDEDLLAMTPAERAKRIGFMPQLGGQELRLTVLEAVISALSAGAGWSGDPLPTAVAVLERLGIGALAMRELAALSGGQRLLAGLAQAIAREAPVLLLDEPTSALDLAHQWQVMAAIRQLADGGRIVIVVLHDLALAARWADRLIVLSEGRLVASGRPTDVLTTDLLSTVYGVEAAVLSDGAGGVFVRIDDLVSGIQGVFDGRDPDRHPA